jgi:hypothetical protein
VPRAPLPVTSVTCLRVVSCTTSKGVTPPSSLLRAHASDQIPPPELRAPHLYPAVFAGCCQPLLEDGLSRRYPASLSPGAWVSIPVELRGALARFFPHTVSLPQDTATGRLSASVRPATSRRCCFRDSHHSLRSGPRVCLPPRSLPPLWLKLSASRAAVAFTSEQNTCRYLHAHRIC